MTGEEKGLPEISVFRPCMNDEEANAVREVLKSGWIGLGPKTKQLEEEFAKYVGAKHAIATNSCSGALHLALDAIGATKGDEIITTALTFVSTSHAIILNGAKPVFADIDPETLNIDPVDVRKKITNKTKAILAVHYGGHPCNLEELRKIANEYNLILIDDAAHACGSEYNGKKIGGSNMADLTCFSFHAVKNLATADGGMVTTDNEEFAKRIKRMNWVGMTKDTYERSVHGFSWDYDILDYGFKYHMNDITAAIGLVQLKKLETMNQKRREIARMYDDAFRDLNWIATPIVKPNILNSQHHYRIMVKNGKRNELYNHLKALKISTSVHYKPVYMFTIYQSDPYFRSIRLSTTEQAWKECLLLPVYPDMTQEEVKRVIEGIRSFEKTFRSQEQSFNQGFEQTISTPTATATNIESQFSSETYGIEDINKTNNLESDFSNSSFNY